MKNLAFSIGAIALLCGAVMSRSAEEDLGRMPDLNGAVSWLNSTPLSGKSLRGKVVLVNFWTYSCVNSLRELPYIKAWAEKYKDAGLVVIGVHAPEFGFEKDPGNVQNAVASLRVGFPVAVDSKHSIWSAFHNAYWPADYVLDTRGRIRYRHFGEGDYDTTERLLQKLLKENGATRLDETLVGITGTGAEAPPSADVRSPETYLGYARAENFAGSQQIAPDTHRNYRAPTSLGLNQWAVSGLWNVGGESIRLGSGSGAVVFRFHSRDVHMVLGPGKAGKPIRFKVKLDGAAPGENHGVDSAGDGSGEVREPRMYQLIRQRGRIRDVTFEIEFIDSGVEAFSFTFG